MTDFINSTAILAYREWLRFVRSPGRVVGAVGAPLLFWAMIGSGMGGSFQIGAKVGYLEYFFPGMLLMVILFTSIFASISLIEDRNEGFLQLVLVTRVPRGAVVAGKVLGASILSTVQALALVLISPIGGIPIHFANLPMIAADLFLLSLALSSLGFLCAWRFNSVQSFHSVMNLVLFPLWLLSGALFPGEGASFWIRALMLINPLTYGLSNLRFSLFGTLGSIEREIALPFTIFFVLLFFGVSVAFLNRTKVPS